MHEMQAGRPEQEAAGEIGQDRRLAEELGANSEDPGRDNGKGDVLDQPVHAPPPRLAPIGRP
jgi:hypothetical protein